MDSLARDVLVGAGRYLLTSLTIAVNIFCTLTGLFFVVHFVWDWLLFILQAYPPIIYIALVSMAMGLVLALPYSREPYD